MCLERLKHLCGDIKVNSYQPNNLVHFRAKLGDEIEYLHWNKKKINGIFNFFFKQIDQKVTQVVTCLKHPYVRWIHFWFKS